MVLKGLRRVIEINFSVQFRSPYYSGKMVRGNNSLYFMPVLERVALFRIYFQDWVQVNGLLWALTIWFCAGRENMDTHCRVANNVIIEVTGVPESVVALGLGDGSPLNRFARWCQL